MNRVKLYLLILGAGLLFSQSCQKGAELPETSIEIPDFSADSSSTTTVRGDTTVVRFSNLTISYFKTNHCFPSTEQFTFRVSSTTIPSSATYKWRMGDGNEKTGALVTHTYNLSSQFVVRLDVIINGTTQVSVGVPIRAWGDQIRPIAIFSHKFDFASNVNYVTFNSASSINRGSIVNYFWDWGDGTTRSTAVGLVRHEFPRAPVDKVYNVRLRITANSGCTHDTVMPVTILADYPITGGFSAVAQNPCTDEEFTFTAQATSVPTGAIYVWDFSDGEGTKTGNPVKHRYRFMNDYDVIMSIYLDGRLIYRKNQMVSAKGPNPRPRARFQETLVSETATTMRWSFNSQSTIPYGGIDGFRWDFGNGIVNDDYNSFIETTYQKESTDKSYSVRLIVRGNGCADTTIKNIFIPRR
ncbi:MAG: PKD domain-containing protein [Hydrotalea sp.]|nr:PKD domain-containing protein [Hydrotalea sp.]